MQSTSIDVALAPALRLKPAAKCALNRMDAFVVAAIAFASLMIACGASIPVVYHCFPVAERQTTAAVPKAQPPDGEADPESPPQYHHFADT